MSAWVRTCEFLYHFLSAKKVKDKDWGVIQNLPIKCCPEACISNGANLGIFIGYIQGKVGGSCTSSGWRKAPYCTCNVDKTSQQQSEGSYDEQHLIRRSPEQEGFALMPQGFLREEKISAYRVNMPLLFIYSLSSSDELTAKSWSKLQWAEYCYWELTEWQRVLQFPWPSRQANAIREACSEKKRRRKTLKKHVWVFCNTKLEGFPVVIAR